MKVKFLKKVRKRYTFKYDKTEQTWTILDHHKQRCYIDTDVQNCMSKFISELLGFGSLINYLQRKTKLKNLKEYKNALCK
jgi:hypothetical protein